MMLRTPIHGIMAVVMLMTSILIAAPADAQRRERVRYARTELDRALGNCAVAVIGGAVLGGILGGRNNRTEGALIGAAAGGVVCAILVRNARRKDRIMAAQLATLTHSRDEFATSFADQNGQAVQFSGFRGSEQQVDATMLRPVRYELEGVGRQASPVLAAGPQNCRPVDSSVTGPDGQTSALPRQMFCRNADGDYFPYAVETS